MKYRKPADIDKERDLLMKEMIDKNSEHSKLFRADKEHPKVKAKQVYLNDLGAAFFPSHRGNPASAPTPSFPENNPAKVGYWLDGFREREELYKSAIVATLRNSNSSQEQLRELVADLLTNYIGLIESGIDNIQSHKKGDNTILLPSGKYISADILQQYFNQFTIRSTLFRLMTFNEKIMEARQNKRKSAGKGTQPAVGSAAKEAIRQEYAKYPGNSVPEFYDRLRDEGWVLPSQRTVERYTKDLRQR